MLTSDVLVAGCFRCLSSLQQAYSPVSEVDDLNGIAVVIYACFGCHLQSDASERLLLMSSNASGIHFANA